MEFRLAEIGELKSICDMYNDIIDHQEYDRYSADWTKDVYPSRNDIQTHLEKDLVYVAIEEGRYAGGGIVSLHEEDMYRNASWTNRYADDEIAVLHLFAVHPDFRRRGLSKALLKYIIEETGKTSKAIHLDVVKGNEAAFHTYEKAGFKAIGEYEVYYEDTGNIMVNLMEYDYKR